MTKDFSTLLLAAIGGLLIVAIGLGFLSGFSNPVPWLLIVVLFLLPKVYDRIKPKQTIVWDESYSVGVDVLDQDHKKLIELLNKFKTAYDYHTSEEYEREALEELVDYTKFHFNREEELMEKFNYPDLVAHKAEHEKMIQQVEVFAALYQKKGHDCLNEVSDFLQDWLIKHINGVDKHYSSYIK